jgi:hypothetical protein
MILFEKWIEQLEENADELGLSDTMFCMGGMAPTEHEANRAYHLELVEQLGAEAVRRKWPGVQFCLYLRRDGFVSIYVAPAQSGSLTLTGLAEHREAQKRAPPLPELSSVQIAQLA